MAGKWKNDADRFKSTLEIVREREGKLENTRSARQLFTAIMFILCVIILIVDKVADLEDATAVMEQTNER